MRFSLSATTALLLQVSSTAEAASSSSSAAAATFLDAFEFGRSPPIQRKRNNHRGLVIQTESTTRRMTKTSKVDAVSSSSSESSSPDAKASKKSSSLDGSSSADAKSSKKGGYHLFSKYTKQATAEVAAFSMDAIGSMFIQPPHMTKAYKTADMFTEMSYSLADFDSFSMPLDFFSMSTSEFSMPGATTATPTSSPPEGSGDTGDASPSPTPRDPQPNNFQEVIFKYLSVCTGVELEMDCLTSTTIDALMTMNGGDATRARARRFLGTETTMAPTPVFVRPTRSPMAPTPSPTVTEVTPPTPAPGTPFPTEPVPPPTPVPGTPFPTEPVPPPTPVPGTPFPTEPVATPAPTDQCRPEVNDDDLLSILTTSKQECIDSGTPISDDEFQATFSSFMLIFDESNTCWNTLCGDSDPTGDLFFQILFDQASECADVTLSVDECILDHILEVVFQPDAPDNSATRVRRSLQESCCEEPTESDLNFYASYLLLSADAACADKGSVKITTDEWNKATDDLVKLFGATKCWGVEPCEDGDGEVVVNPTPSSSDEDAAISGDVVLPYYEGPVLSEDSEVCTLATDSYAPEEVRSLELSFYYQVETTSDSLDLGLIERELIALVCDDAGNERRLSELETEVVAVDASPEDVISEEYTCTPSTPGTNCHVVKGAITILLVGPITPNEETLLLAKIASLFPIASDDTEVSSITYLGGTPTPVTSTKDAKEEASTYNVSPFGITVAATAVVAAALLARGAATRRTVQDPAHPEDTDNSKEEYKGQDELTIAATAELTCASDDPSPKHHVVNDEERDHWRELGMEGQMVNVDV